MIHHDIAKTVTISAMALMVVCLARPGLAQPRYENHEGGTYLKFLNDSETGDRRGAPPTLLMSFGGDPVRAVMDTGSTGIVVAASSIPDIDSLRQIGPGTLTYSSSGRIMRGRWVETRVTIGGSNDQSVTTRPIAVLAVERIDCVPHPRNCEPSDAPRHVAMMGVGFAREGDHQSQSTPDKNPFLNLPGMGTMAAPGRLTRGYVVTRAGVHVGLTAANTRGNYRFVQLQRAADGRDWGPLPACIAVDGGAPACGTALIDTGVSVMYLTVPADRAADRTQAGERGGQTLAPGTRLSIRFGDATAERPPGYGFATGDTANPAAPERIVLVGGENRPTFVNTSVHALNAFDYLFDADAGVVGFRMIDR
ncbi:hypothetical protein BJ123_1234 [Rhodopseudomonas thermotolerans]|uniref:Aspartyl protease n=2 Tax=Rhodopseudomonas TaxID=1073 RepID=A0A336JYC1_9BRAD|nr:MULTISPECIES: hypothetical protein [Rhodopseudomonas]RED28068.1 hypothetical protein BJ125_1234 [Rhodopseudomonas pentothenatexigens]REF91322.1 hypothetical protein BJ123_1234 [Rhodopseudomonas thermotolerans]SSW92654.1 hypothetical protein SAMN05892882_1234 [Rhodopseudomonas pentothenatexigens]